MIKVIDEASVRRILSMGELIPVMKRSLAELSAGHAVQPVRVVLPVAEHSGFFGVMPAYNHALGAKLITFYPGNKDVHTHNGVIVLFRPENGEPLAIMDGRLITEMRTAAVSAAATDLLARPDASKLAIIGSGVQARSHLEAIGIVRKLSEVRVWSPRNAAKFAEAHDARLAESVEEAVRDADIVVVATAATKPVLEGKWLSPGTHVNAIGANRPTWRELDDDLLARSTIFVESRAAASSESGDIIAAGRIDAEIGEVVSGVSHGRRSKDEITLFKSLGQAVEDIAAAHLVYQKSVQNSV